HAVCALKDTTCNALQSLPHCSSMIGRRGNAEESVMNDSNNDPDFTKGVNRAAIPDDGMLAGHVGEEPVLLSRVDGKLHAIGAKCTHYGGPLGKGLRVKDTVRCPYHHACFSLRTGEALGAPALDDEPCWKVEEKDGKVFVHEKSECERPSHRPAH